jgi:hypothetical protein
MPVHRQRQPGGQGRSGSREKGFSDPAGLSHAAWAGKEGACLVLDEAVEGVVAREALLDGDELPARVTLEADEEQAGIHMSVDVHAVVEGVAASQQTGTMVDRWRCETDMRVGRHHEASILVTRCEIYRVVLTVAT